MGSRNIDPARVPVKLPPVLAFIAGVPVAPRCAVEALIERAIEALDTMDGDPDIEPDDPPEEDGYPELDEHGDTPAVNVYDNETREWIGINASRFIGAQHPLF